MVFLYYVPCQQATLAWVGTLFQRLGISSNFIALGYCQDNLSYNIHAGTAQERELQE